MVVRTETAKSVFKGFNILACDDSFRQIVIVYRQACIITGQVTATILTKGSSFVLIYIHLSLPCVDGWMDQSGL